MADVAPGAALDLASGGGRHSRWLLQRGWNVTAVDRAPEEIEGARVVRADLETGEFVIAPAAWDLIVCWLYWQPDLVGPIAAGLRPGGVAALAGKTTGRFAVSLRQLREGFPGWRELASGENETRAFLIVRRV